MTQRMQHLARSISLGICIALGVGSLLAAQQRESIPLTATGEKVQAQYAATLKALQVEIARPLPNVPEQKKADLVKAREALKAAETAANTAQSSQAKIRDLRSWVAPRSNFSTDPKLERYPLVGHTGCDVSVSEIRDDWDGAKATFAEAAPGKSWASRELDAGGKFISLATQVDTIKPVQTLTFDVTPAIREAMRLWSRRLLVRFTSCYNRTGPASGPVPLSEGR